MPKEGGERVKANGIREEGGGRECKQDGKGMDRERWRTGMQLKT